MNYSIKAGTEYGYMGSVGYVGENSKTALHGTELKTAIVNELKKNGFKVSGKTARGGWTDSFTFTFKLSVNDLNRYSNIDDYINSNYSKYMKYREYNYNDGEILELINKGIGDKFMLNQYYINECPNLKEAAIERMELANQIICSFNYSESNAMVDYFNVGFYYNLYIQVTE